MKIGCCSYSYREYLQSGEMSPRAVHRHLRRPRHRRRRADVILLPQNRQGIPELTQAALSDKRSRRIRRRRGKQADPGGRRRARRADRDGQGVARSRPDPGRATDEGIRRRNSPAGHTDEEAFDWAVAAFKECVPVAADAGVVMALENHGGITSTSAQVIRLIEAVDSEWLRVNLDIGNYGFDTRRRPI